MQQIPPQISLRHLHKLVTVVCLTTCVGCFLTEPEEYIGIAITGIPYGLVGRSYVGRFQAPGAADARWELVEGGVPGLTLARNGELTGVPVEVGDWPMTVRVGSGDRRNTRELTVKVYEPLQIFPERLPGGIVGIEFQVHLSLQFGVNNSDRSQISVIDGQLPAGLTIFQPLPGRAPSYLRGVPQVIGSSTFTLQAVRFGLVPYDTAYRTYTMAIAQLAQPTSASIQLGRW
jgi:hypothetical protein